MKTTSNNTRTCNYNPPCANVHEERFRDKYLYPLIESARRGNADCLVLGFFYKEGFLVPQDNAKAAFWYGQCFRSWGILPGFDTLFRRHRVPLLKQPFFSSGLFSKDPWEDKGLLTHQPALERDLQHAGYPTAAHGSIPEESMKWIRQAAENGREDAIQVLAAAYALGWGIKQDDALALKWLLRLADKDDSYPSITLGTCYEFGILTEAAPLKAIYWYSLFADWELYGMEDRYQEAYLQHCKTLGLQPDMRHIDGMSESQKRRPQ